MHIFPFHENSLNPFQRWMIIESKAEGRVPDYVLGRKYTYIRARSHKQDSFVRRFFFLVPPFHEFLPSRKRVSKIRVKVAKQCKERRALRGKNEAGMEGEKERERKKKGKKNMRNKGES